MFARSLVRKFRKRTVRGIALNPPALSVAPLTAYYYKSPDGLGVWEDLEYWWSNADGTGTHPETIPWATEDTKALNLGIASGVANLPECSSDLGNIVGAWTITGTCTAAYGRFITNNSIYSGTFNLVGSTGLEMDGNSTKFSGTLIGPARFNGAGCHNDGTITGDCLFDGINTYNNNGNITGDCEFMGGSSANLGTVTGDCYFSGDYSYQGSSGTITGTTVTFAGVGSNNEGTITATSVNFTGASSSNLGTVNATYVDFLGSASNNTATGVIIASFGITFNGAASNSAGALIGDIEVTGYGVTISGNSSGDLHGTSSAQNLRLTDLTVSGTYTITMDGDDSYIDGLCSIGVDDIVVNGQYFSIFGDTYGGTNIDVNYDILINGYSPNFDSDTSSTYGNLSASRLILTSSAQYAWIALSGYSYEGMFFDVYCEASDVSFGYPVIGDLYITASAYSTVFIDGNIAVADNAWTVPTPWPD